MQPFVNLLLEEKEEIKITEKEQKLAKYAGKVWADFLKSLEREGRKGTLPGLPIGLGQKPPELREVGREGREEPQIGAERGPYRPATPPPLGAIGKRRRTGGYPPPVIGVLPDRVRYARDKEGDKDVIKINKKYPAYSLRKSSLALYIWETLILEYAKAENEEEQTAGEYLEEINRMLWHLGRFIKNKGIRP